MSAIPNQNGSFTIKKDTWVYPEGSGVNSVSIMLQGNFDVFISTCEKYSGLSEEDIIGSSYKIFSMDKNLFLGANDLFQSGKCSFSYRTAQDSNIYAFMLHSLEQVKNLVESQKDYSAYIVTSICNLIELSHAAYIKLERFSNDIKAVTDNLLMFFWVLKERYGLTSAPSSESFKEGLENLRKIKENNISFPPIFAPALFEKEYLGHPAKDHSADSKLNPFRIDYYKRIARLPLELRKSFFAADTALTFHQCNDASKLLHEIQAKIKAALVTSERCFKTLYDENEECIFTEYVRAAMDLSDERSSLTEMRQILDYIAVKVKKILQVYKNEYSHIKEVDLDYLDSLLVQVEAVSGADNARPPSLTDSESSVEVLEGSEAIPDELRDSLEKILFYSDLPKEKVDMFKANIEAFKNLKDKLSPDAAAMETRKSAASVFYEIYEAVFKKVHLENNTSRLFHMFLTYAYMDENLLSPQNTVALYRLAEKSGSAGQCPVYSTKEWLNDIYCIEKEPSINEFGQDYHDTFREMKRRGEVSDKDKQAYDNNKDGRLSFEIHNMFRINQRLCYGQISSFFPVLHNDMISRNLSKAQVTADKISECVNRILEVDYSAFHREISYRNPQKGIEKEFVMKAVPPDIILMPTYGSRAIMWQEITGRSRSTPGRFILPIFTSESLEDMLVKLIGNFRWELCRTMMGVAWNDITQKSLTSEYTDYIQFYRKNKDLSEEAKEKVKAQIQKHRNMMKDIFTSDYETWINFESKGNVRLNKIVRGILYRHCSFSRPIREQLEKQPMYSDIAMQFKNLRNKQARETESRYMAYTKSGVTLDPDLEHNLKFYRDM